MAFTIEQFDSEYVPAVLKQPLLCPLYAPLIRGKWSFEYFSTLFYVD